MRPLTKILLALLLALPASAAWPNGYTYRRAITVDHTKVSSADQIGFPVLVRISDPTLKTVANGGHVQNSSAFDVAFTASSGGTPLPWEIDSYDGVQGELWAWVNLPTLSSSSDTLFYIYYGKASIHTLQSVVAAAWDTDFKGVYHLGSSSALSTLDSTANSNLAISQGTPLSASGQMGGAALFNGSSSFVTGNGLVLNSSSMTIESWIKTAGGGYTGIANRDDFGSNRVFQFRVNASNHLEFIPFPGGSPIAVAGSTNVADGAWHFAAATYNGAVICVYVDGVLEASVSASGALPAGTLPLYIGDINYSNNFFTGSIDEIRYSAIARSAGWLAASYNNQNSPATFSSLGGEQTFSGTTQSSLIIF